MLAIGLGKARGASTIHGYGTKGLKEIMPECAKVFLQSGRVFAGIAIVENALHQTGMLKAIPYYKFEDTEAFLLDKARQMMATLPFDNLDLLILDRMGKDISGPGMDSAITGRIMANGEPDLFRPQHKLIAVLDLSEASHGNAVGVGVADLISQRLSEKIDIQATYVNSICGGYPVQGKIPMVMPDDETLLNVAALLIGSKSITEARIVHVDSTLNLEEFEVSQNMISELDGLDNVKVIGIPHALLGNSLSIKPIYENYDKTKKR